MNACLNYSNWALFVEGSELIDQCVDDIQLILTREPLDITTGKTTIYDEGSYSTNAIFSTDENTVTFGPERTNNLLTGKSEWQKTMRHECLHWNMDQFRIRFEERKMLFEAIDLALEQLKYGNKMRPAYKFFIKMIKERGESLDEEAIAYTFSAEKEDSDLRFLGIVKTFPPKAIEYILNRLSEIVEKYGYLDEDQKKQLSKNIDYHQSLGRIKAMITE